MLTTRLGGTRDSLCGRRGGVSLYGRKINRRTALQAVTIQYPFLI